jgi:CHAT domain-containing protein
VDDQAARLLMVQFYKNWLDSGMSKSDALREAKLALLHGKLSGEAGAPSGRGAKEEFAPDLKPGDRTLRAPKYSHPRYWAPFVLVGDWR